jgi:hypothetical protein
MVWAGGWIPTKMLGSILLHGQNGSLFISSRYGEITGLATLAIAAKIFNLGRRRQRRELQLFQKTIEHHPSPGGYSWWAARWVYRVLA